MKIGIYGGSFNPVHFGHVGLAKWVIENTDLDELWLLVSPNNPLKPAGMLAPEQERLEAVRQAIQDIHGLVASDFEFNLPRPSYTANTLRALQQAYPQHEFTLVIGEDNIAIFDKWREYEYIASNFRIFVYPRNLTAERSNSPKDGLTTKNEVNRALAAEKWSNSVAVKEIRYLSEAPTFDISSTELRQRGNCYRR